MQDMKNILNFKSSHLSNQLNKIFYDSLVQTELNAIRENEIKSYYLAIKHYNTKNTYQQVQAGGILTVRNTNRKIVQCKEEEVEKEHYKRVKHVEKALKKNATDPTQQEGFNFRMRPAREPWKLEAHDMAREVGEQLKHWQALFNNNFHKTISRRVQSLTSMSSDCCLEGKSKDIGRDDSVPMRELKKLRQEWLETFPATFAVSLHNGEDPEMGTWKHKHNENLFDEVDSGSSEA
ncbi:uncharacterized protein PADG_11870 [Paracoccidioides brasiliensis Pb18]|uniref:Uncharacterized protein n=1 Tax=Paracoccidioides brasiliensis (strain Pb18) TaxID=502780 RepID=A0A0A0HS78_PARBD|nr:uncharacterized protein PADG_11870 [Paracoccidioides brasiliensis Pb18]KGM92074.1 hypothetical protein PADG_11870 [Paracoccidioides brasiliensis Pb18]